jgi:bifunctional DNA-binding transcriptional regulator/antitoxin component of YhaV-PrlF toxin-antitoxin module
MPHEITLNIVNGDLRLTLPEDVVNHMRLEDGQRVHLIETSQGVLLVPYDADFDDAMQIYEDGVSTYRDALCTLADTRST